MNLKKITFEGVLFALAILLAFYLRFVRLGSLPLSDAEAIPALQALDIVKGAHPILGAQAGYVILTSLLFFLFESSSFMARFWPALFGSLIVLAPILLRSKIGREAAVVLAFGLALDPGMVSLSRIAGGPMLAVAATVLALAFWLTGRPVWGGIFAGFALMGGPEFWMGAAGLVIAYGLYRWQNSDAQAPAEGDTTGSIEKNIEVAAPQSQRPWKPGLIAALATVLAGGTLFLTIPAGLSAAASGFPAFLKGWIQSSGLPILLLPAALLSYEPLALVFGIWRGFSPRDELDRFLRIWVLVALLLALAYPGRQTADLAWTILPLWLLAARQLGEYLSLPEDNRLTAVLYTGFVIGSLIYTWMNVVGIGNPASAIVDETHWIAIGGALLLLVLASLLVAWGWSREAVSHGAVWGISLALLLFTFAATWNGAQLRGKTSAEMWAPEPVTDQSRLMAQVLSDLSQWKTGQVDSIDVMVTGITSPALRWDLRAYKHTTFADRLPPGVQTAIVITPLENQPALSAAYRGESFVWYSTPDWTSLFPTDWLSWLTFRQIPSQDTKLILWARTDVFPGGQAPAQTGNTAP
jgi:hypothetical protein